jgi:hypothetical protein
MKNIIYTFAIVMIVHCTFNIDNCEAQWVEVSSGIGNKNVYTLASNGNYLFAGTNGTGVYLSINNGTNWTQTSLNNRHVLSLAVNGNNVFAGTVIYGVYLSTNNGSNWSQTSLNNQYIYSLAVNGNNIFAGTNLPGNGVYLSTNNGTNWIQTSLNNREVVSLAVYGNNIFAGTGLYGVYLSTNNGTNWTQTSLNNRTVYALAVNGNNVFAGTNNYGIYLSTNNGTNWTQTYINNLDILSLAIYGNNIFASSGTDGVFVSNNNGTNWTQRNEGFGNAVVNALCISNNYIFAGTFINSVYRRPLSEVIGIKPISEQVPAHFALEQNYPNPFNPTTVISFQLSVAGQVVLKVYDVMGREVQTLVNESLKPGTYEASFDGSSLNSGVYFYKISAGEFSETKKMLMIK